MASRILQQATASNKNRVALCCTFLILATATAYTCPFSSAAGVNIDSTLYGSGIIDTQEYSWTQSDGDVGFLSPGQERLTGLSTSGVLSVGRAGHRQVTVINANDHQSFKSAVLDQYAGGGLTWDTVQMSGERRSMPYSTTNTANGTTSNTSTNSTAVVPTSTTAPPRPYGETIEISRGTSGSVGMYTGDKTIEQGSNNSPDYVELNSVATGIGSSTNDIKASSRVGFDVGFNIVNYENTVNVHDVVIGTTEQNYNTTYKTIVESFSTVFMSPSANNTTEGVV